MTKQELIADGQKYANLINAPVYLLRRGSKYTVSQIEKTGWKIAEMILPVSA